MKIRDSVGVLIPEAALPYWERKGWAEELVKNVNALIVLVKGMEIAEDKMWAEVCTASALADLQRLKNNLSTAIPYAVCGQCQGQPQTQPGGECRLCRGRGLISKHRYMTVPEVIRKMKEGM